jgi:hypothetical protein
MAADSHPRAGGEPLPATKRLSCEGSRHVKLKPKTRQGAGGYLSGQRPAGVTGAERPDKPSHERTIEEKPTGTPTSDRHGTETAHQWEDEHKARK